MQTSKNVSCVECSVENSRYKCPRCEKSYCSIKCCNRHKSGTQCIKDLVTVKQEPFEETPVNQKNVKALAHMTDDTIPPSNLELLKTNDELKSLLKKDVNLQRLLLTIDDSSNPAGLLKRAMATDSSFQRFASICLKTVINDDGDEQNEYENAIRLATALCENGNSEEIDIDENTIQALLACKDLSESDDETPMFR